MKRHTILILLASFTLCSLAGLPFCSAVLTTSEAAFEPIEAFQATGNPLSLGGSDSSLLGETSPESTLDPESFNPFLISGEFLYLEQGLLPWNAIAPYIEALHWAEINGHDEAITENLYAISAIIEYGTVESLRSGLPIMAEWTDRQIFLIQEAIDARVIRNRTRVSAALFFAYMRGGFFASESFFIFQIYQLRLDQVLIKYIELGTVGVESFVADALIASGMSADEAFGTASLMVKELIDFLEGFEDGKKNKDIEPGRGPSYYLGYLLGKLFDQLWEWLKDKLDGDGPSGDPSPIIWPGPLWCELTFQGASLTYSIVRKGELYFEMDAGIDLEAELGLPSGTIPDVDPIFIPGFGS